MFRKALIRAYHHPWWIPALSAVAVISLVGTMVLFVLFSADQASERQRSRRTDAIFCARANDLRAQVIDIGDAGEDLVHGIVDVVLPPDAQNGERAAAIRRIRAEMEPVFERYREAVDEVRFIDCENIPRTPERPGVN